MSVHWGMCSTLSNLFIVFSQNSQKHIIQFSTCATVVHSQLAEIRPSSVKFWTRQVPWDESEYFYPL